MGKKDRMLAFIKNNVGWFMTAPSSNIEVIPYYVRCHSPYLSGQSSI